MVDTPGSGGTLSVEPVASGTAHYQTKVALAELIVSQSLQLNVYLGQPLLVDGAIGRLVIRSTAWSGSPGRASAPPSASGRLVRRSPPPWTCWPPTLAWRSGR